MTDLEKNTAEERGRKTGRLAAVRQKIPKLPLDGLKRRFKKETGTSQGSGRKSSRKNR